MNEIWMKWDIKWVWNVEMTDSWVNLSANWVWNIKVWEEWVNWNWNNMWINTKNMNVWWVKIDKDLLDSWNVTEIDTNEFFDDDITSIQDSNDNINSQFQWQNSQSNWTMQMNWNSMSNWNMQQNLDKKIEINLYFFCLKLLQYFI